MMIRQARPNRFEIPILQAAGVRDSTEARLLMACGVDYLGFPLRLDVNLPDLSEDEARRVIAEIEPPHHAVLITYLDTATEILELMDYLGAKVVQIHGDIADRELRALRFARPEIGLIKSLVVTAHNEDHLARVVEETSGLVDAFITDTFDPATGRRGATGMTHDWAISRRLVELSTKPVILAGGLSPDNVAEAIRVVGPAGVDVHTGIEDALGRKDEALTRAFFERARLAFDQVARGRRP